MPQKQFVFNWEIFKQKGFEFQDLCADIFRHYQYDVHVMGQGGDDRGRDIEVYKRAPVNLIDGTSKELLAWVECKSSVSSSINLPDVGVNFVYAVKERITYLIFITNNRFTNPAHNVFVSFNKDPGISIKIRSIEKDELEAILRGAPEIYLKYFDKEGVKEEYIYQDDSPVVMSNVEANSKFVDDFDGYRIKLKSLAFETSKIEVTTSDNVISEIILQPLEEKEIFVKSDRFVSNAIPKISSLDGKTRINLNLDLPKALFYKIDHTFVDPYHLKEDVLDKLQFNNHIYIAGYAGRGKTRLLKEVCKSLNQSPSTIDVSADYNKSFLDHVLTKLLNIEKEYLTLLPEENIAEYIADKLTDNISIEVLVSYIKGKSEINYDIIISAVTELFVRMFESRIVLIDNIHNFSLLDYKLFKSIIDSNKSTKIVCTARDNEIGENNLKLYLENLIERDSILIFDLGATNISDLLRNFIDEVSIDKATADFLKKYQATENFQEFIAILKNLKTKGILQQTTGGKVCIDNVRHELNTSTYSSIYQDLIRTVQSKLEGYPVDTILKTAATFGYRFPIDLVEQYLVDSSLLDELIAYELLVIDDANTTYLKFDHELTREIVYNSIPPLQRNNLHKNVIKYLRALDSSSPVFSFRQLCYQYEAIKDFSNSAIYSNKEAHNLIRKSEPADAYSFFKKTLDCLKQSNEESSQELYELEADTLDWLIRLGPQLGHNKDTYNLIRSLHVLTHLVQKEGYEGIVFYHFAKYYFDHLDDTPKARIYIDKAINYFKENDAIEYAKALNYKGVIEKNAGNYDEALELHTIAIKIFEEIKDWEGLSEAYVDMGAVYLEKGEGLKTPDWWKKSLDIIKRTSNLTQICDRLIDSSYINALYNTDELLIKGELENAIFMAKRLKSSPNICRALINYANYLFKIGDRTSDIKSTIDNAIQIAHDNNLDYLELLSKFSYLMFQRASVNLPNKYENDIEKYLVEHYSDISMMSSIGDNRVINIFKYFIAERNSLIMGLLRTISNKVLSDFHKDISELEISIIEKGNPYFTKGIYLTYY